MFTPAGTKGAIRRGTRCHIGHATSERIMKKARENPDTQEPIGIIISRGDRTEQRPIFSAYIWGPAPEPAVESTTKVA